MIDPKKMQKLFAKEAARKVTERKAEDKETTQRPNRVGPSTVEQRGVFKPANVNSAGETQTVIAAWRQIDRRFGKYLPHNTEISNFKKTMLGADPIEIGQYIKFKNPTEFPTLLGRNPLRGKCLTVGFTVRATPGLPHRSMWICRGRASPGTVVHEMLHFLTHKKFEKSVDAVLNEAVTEYLTRKVLGSKKTDEQFNPSQRSTGYDLHYGVFAAGKLGLKNSHMATEFGKGSNWLKRAYFAGDKQCIGYLVENFGELGSAEELRMGLTES